MHHWLDAGVRVSLANGIYVRPEKRDTQKGNGGPWLVMIALISKWGDKNTVAAARHDFAALSVKKNRNVLNRFRGRMTHTFIESHHIHTVQYIYPCHSPASLLISSSLVSSLGKTSLWCRAENRTRACLTASRRARTRDVVALWNSQNFFCQYFSAPLHNREFCYGPSLVISIISCTVLTKGVGPSTTSAWPG